MSDYKLSVLAGAAVSIAISLLPFISILNCCCGGAVIGGMVAIWHYSRQQEALLHSGDAAKIGGIAGLLGSVGYLVIVAIYVASSAGNFQAFLMQGMEQMEAQMPSSQVEQIEQAIGQISPAMILAALIITAVLSGLFGALGGVIGESIFAKDDAESW